MTPITHGLIGYLAATPLESKKDRFFVAAASLIPDLDGLGILVSMDYYAKFHHVLGHNLVFAVFISLVAAILAKNKAITPLLVFFSFHLHILGDLLGSGAGWGVYYFWPFNRYLWEFKPPFQWELDSWQNLLVTAVCVGLIIRFSLSKNRTILEFFSSRLDKTVVDVFKKWFTKN